MVGQLTRLAVLMTLCSVTGCAHGHAESQPEPLRVVVLASVPGEAWFCVEDPGVNGYFDEPQIRHGRIDCPLTVNQLRRAIAQLRAAD
jgi:hypothetical protein